MARCAWAGAEGSLMCRYHDEEWGKEEHDDRKLFEMLLLESFQAGLSWQCILNKREAFREAFDGFDPEKIAEYDSGKIEELMENRGIVRNRRKIVAAVRNAQVFLELQRQYGSFDAYLRTFTKGEVVKSGAGFGLTHSPLSDALSADLHKRGMRFVGTVIVYSFLQATGAVNDHEEGCFLFAGE